MEQSDIKIEKSNGSNSFAGAIYFVRPLADCMNRSRKVSVRPGESATEKIEKVIAKWFFPKVIIYNLNGWKIGSNSKENALKEYWRVCAEEEIGKTTEVTQL